MRFLSASSLLSTLLLFTAPARAAEPQEHPRAPEPEPRHFRVGAIAGVGFPRPFVFEGLVKLERPVALGVEYSTLPVLNSGGVRAVIWAIAADARVFPFGGAFFVGFNAGFQHLSGSATLPIGTVGLEMDSILVTPRLGLLWTSRAGLTLGVDAGVQIPVSVSTSSSIPASSRLGDEAMTLAATFGRRALPTIDLLQIGLLL
jgi:hypothetical protein